ncbi:MAG: hypothetical protein VW715_16585 [Rhodospirillales bacterium]
MKPWFAKEADIIKFPAPEKKVIELPNVQSYPDFLTGVKDLHNRKAKGEISQDSHDRLYQDLIHMFMRKESFETPWFIREQSKDRGLNRGDAMEFLTAAAVHHRLISVNYISDESLKNFIMGLKKTNPVTHKHTDGMDTFNMNVGVKNDTFKHIFNPKVYDTAWKGLIPLAVKFANQQLRKQLEFIHNNERKDSVEINSFGMAGDKVDVQAVVAHKDPSTGKIIKEPLEDLNMSLKIDSGKFGQSSGFNTKEGNSFKKLFGLLGFDQEINGVLKDLKIEEFVNGKYGEYLAMSRDTSPLRKNGKASPEYQKAEKAGQKANAMALPRLKQIFKKMANKMNDKFTNEKTDERAEYELLGNLISAEFQGDQELTFLQYTKNGYAMIKGTELKKLIDFVKNEVELSVRYVEKDKNPYLVFVDGDEELLHVRTSFNHYGYLRTFIEQGPGMDKFKQTFK